MTSTSAPAARPFFLRASQIPNMICVGRILLVWPIVRSLLADQYPTALALILLAGFSDGLDGFLAKRFDWRTRLGGLLDPLADKLLIVSAYLTLWTTGAVPAWLTAVVIARDMIIVAGGVAYQVMIGPVEPLPSRVSKLNTGAQLLFLLTVIANHAFGFPPAVCLVIGGAAVLVTCVVSGLDYVLCWSRKAAAAVRG